MGSSINYLTNVFFSAVVSYYFWCRMVRLESGFVLFYTLLEPTERSFFKPCSINSLLIYVSVSQTFTDCKIYRIVITKKIHSTVFGNVCFCVPCAYTNCTVHIYECINMAIDKHMYVHNTDKIVTKYFN